MLHLAAGFILGVLTCVGALIVEEYLESASLRDEGRLPYAPEGPFLWVA